MKKRILVADDEQIILDLIKEILEIKGYEVTCVDNGREAVAEAKRSHFDFFILDMRMPSLDGLETLKELLKLDPDTKALIITGYAVDAAMEEAVRLGAVGYLLKPFKKLDDIYDIIEKTLGQPVQKRV